MPAFPLLAWMRLILSHHPTLLVAAQVTTCQELTLPGLLTRKVALVQAVDVAVDPQPLRLRRRRRRRRPLAQVSRRPNRKVLLLRLVSSSGIAQVNLLVASPTS